MIAERVPSRHRELTSLLHRIKTDVARDITDEFFDRHPSWWENFGDVGYEHGIRDARFHIEFLAGSVEAKDPVPFADYVRWAARLLEARGIQRRHLAENLEQVRGALNERISDPGWRQFVDRTLAEGLGALEDEADQGADGLAERPAEPVSCGPDGAAELLQVYLSAILSGSRPLATSVLEKAMGEGWAVPDLYLHVIQPAQGRLGELWADNRISVAQEHMASAVTQAVLSHLYPHLPESPVRRGAAVVTGAEGELHQLGAHMVADILESDGWDVRFLGTQLPHETVVEEVLKADARLVCISITMAFNLGWAADLIERVRERFPEGGPKILVGGRAFHSSERAWREVGADHYAIHLLEARDLARTLGEEGPAGRG